MTPRRYEHPSRKRDREKYAAALGGEAAVRQVEEARDRFYCCGELKDDGHHPLCSKRRDQDLPPEHIDGQESLL